MLTSGPAAPKSGTDLSLLRTPHLKRKPRFEVVALTDSGKPVINPATMKPYETLIQRSMVDEDRQWVVTQTKDTIRPGHPSYNPKSHQAKTEIGRASCRERV